MVHCGLCGGVKGRVRGYELCRLKMVAAKLIINSYVEIDLARIRKNPARSSQM